MRKLSGQFMEAATPNLSVRLYGASYSDGEVQIVVLQDCWFVSQITTDERLHQQSTTTKWPQVRQWL